MNISACLLLLLSTANSVVSFSLHTPPARISTTRLASTKTPEDFFKAVQSAAFSTKKYDLDELDRLATELEDFKGCAYEEGDDEICDKEVQDRLDVAEILRLKIELQLRLDYLENANLFADDVRKEHDVEEHKQFKEDLIANQEKRAGAQAGSDLGLW